jgi:hypothetical protein
MTAQGFSPSRKSICTGRWAGSLGRQIQGPEAMGSCERAPRMCCCQWVNSVAEQAQSACPMGQPIGEHEAQIQASAACAEGQSVPGT